LVNLPVFFRRVKPQPPDEPVPPIDPSSPSLDVIFDALRARLSAQDAQIATLDGKAGFVLGSASLLTAGAVGLRGAIFPTAVAHHGWGPISAESIGITEGSVALLIYLLLVLVAGQAYAIRKYGQVPKIHELLLYFPAMQPQATRSWLVRAMAVAIGENAKTITKKIRWAKWALRLLALEALCLAVLAATPLTLL
jgi:hypothetical protein